MATAPGPDSVGPAKGEAELAAWADRFAHDLRSPLAVISGMAETLERAWDRLPEPNRAEMLSSIRRQAAKAAALLDDRLSQLRAPAKGEKDT